MISPGEDGIDPGPDVFHRGGAKYEISSPVRCR